MLLHTTGLGLFLQIMVWLLVLPIVLAVGIIWCIVKIIMFIVEVVQETKEDERRREYEEAHAWRR